MEGRKNDEGWMERAFTMISVGREDDERASIGAIDGRAGEEQEE